MRVGVVGCGYWGAKHVRVLHGLTGVDGVVAIDPRDGARDAIGRVFPGVELSADVGTGIDRVDAVVVASPPLTHFQVASNAIARGRHVLVEKPIAVTSGDAAALVDSAERAGVILMAGHTYNYNAAVRRLRETIQSGALGRAYYVDSVRLNLGPIRRDVNVIGDLAPHDISIINFVLGARPDAVTAWGSALTHELIEDTANLRLDYEALNVSATIRVSWLDPCKVRRVTAVGDRLMAVYDDLDDNERLRLYDRGVEAAEHGADHESPMSYRYGAITSPYLHYREPLLVEDEDFVSSITEGRRPIADGRSGLEVVQVVEAAQQSVRERRTVPINWAALGAPALASSWNVGDAA